MTLKARTLFQKIQKKEIEDNGILHVSDLIGKAIELDRDNVEAQTFQNEMQPEIQKQQRQNIIKSNLALPIKEVELVENQQIKIVDENSSIDENVVKNNFENEAIFEHQITNLTSTDKAIANPVQQLNSTDN